MLAYQLNITVHESVSKEIISIRKGKMQLHFVAFFAEA